MKKKTLCLECGSKKIADATPEHATDKIQKPADRAENT